MKEPLRRTLRVIGLLLIAAALCAMGYALWNIIQTDLATRHSLQAVEGLLEALESPDPSDDWVLDDFDREDYTPPPEEDWGGGEEPELTVPPDAPQAQPTATPTAAQGQTARKVPVMGVLVFDGLGGRRVPVVNGASPSDLNRGAGHHPRTSLPGRTGNCVIFGHRNTVFRSFGSLKLGQTVVFEGARNTYTYKITDMKVVQPDNPAIFAVHSGAVMSLVTCYPFNYVGSAPKRYLVTCELVQ